MAILVDKYQMHEVVNYFSDNLIDKLRTEIPETLTTDVRPWLCISWVFEKDDIFKPLTKILVWENSSEMSEASDY